MNKNELSVAIANRVGVPQSVASEMLNAFMEIVTDHLADGEKVQLFGFGTFDIKERGERVAHNPTTKTYSHVAPRRSVVFRPGKMLKEMTDEF